MQQCPNAFKRWDEASWIRSKPMRCGWIDGLPYSPDLVPLVGHAWVQADPARFQTVLAYRLLGHLQFTQVLEIEHVNAVCGMLGRGDGPVQLSGRERQDAIRIYCDEGGHALFTAVFADEVARQFSLDVEVVGRPQFENVLARIIDEHGARVAPKLIRLFFVMVSETLVTRTLHDIPRDPRVAPAVREVLHDHCQDESAHAVYFRGLFMRCWATLSRRERLAIGHILPQLVWAFLGPDRHLEAAVLQALGLVRADAEGLLDEVYRAGALGEAVRHDARGTMAMFERSGVLDDPDIRKTFADYELLAPGEGTRETAASGPNSSLTSIRHDLRTPGEELVWARA